MDRSYFELKTIIYYKLIDKFKPNCCKDTRLQETNALCDLLITVNGALRETELTSNENSPFSPCIKKGLSRQILGLVLGTADPSTYPNFVDAYTMSVRIDNGHCFLVHGMRTEDSFAFGATRILLLDGFCVDSIGDRLKNCKRYYWVRHNWSCLNCPFHLASAVEEQCYVNTSSFRSKLFAT